MGVSLLASAAACSAGCFASGHHHHHHRHYQIENFGARFSRIPFSKDSRNMLPNHLRNDLLHIRTQFIDIKKLKLSFELNQVDIRTSFTLLDIQTQMEVHSSMADLFMSKYADTCVKRRQMVVPFFRRSGQKAHTKTQCSTRFQMSTSAPLNCHEKTKVGGSNPKKKRKPQKKKTSVKMREFYSDSYSSVCESLLSVILIKNSKSMALCSLKRHGHKMPELLMKISAGIAGSGLFAIISAAFKSTEGITAVRTDAAVGVSLLSTILFNTGIGIGMIWLSLAVNMLGFTIIDIAKTVNKPNLKENEVNAIRGKVEKSLKEVAMRAAAVLLVVFFRFA